MNSNRENHRRHIAVWKKIARYKLIRWVDRNHSAKERARMTLGFAIIDYPYCYACVEAATRYGSEFRHRDICKCCPIDWGGKSKEFDEPCTCGTTLFDKWWDVKSPKLAQKYALAIAELPWSPRPSKPKASA